MARARQSPAPAPDAADPSLADVLKKLSGQVAALAAHTEALAQRVQVLTQAVDDFREDIEWALRNDKLSYERGTAIHITSMPKDPLAADFGERINRYTAADLPADLDGPSGSRHDNVPIARTTTSARQGGLWE
jgi:hypothetical protein